MQKKLNERIEAVSAADVEQGCKSTDFYFIEVKRAKPNNFSARLEQTKDLEIGI